MKTRLYLITGFLGAGKTTFLRNFVGLFPGKHISVIVNEFGKEGVDGPILAEAHISSSQICDGSIFCTCRMDQFESVLEQQLESPTDVIVVEASGLSDPTGIQKLLNRNTAFKKIEYAGNVCLADALNFHKVIETAAVSRKQIDACDCVIINKVDIAPEGAVERAESIICNRRPEVPIFKTSFGKVDGSILLSLSPGDPDDGKPVYHTADLTLRKYLITVGDGFTPDKLKEFLEIFAGSTYRVKGFVVMEGRTYLVDCVGASVDIREFHGEPGSLNKLVALSVGSQNARRKIDEAAAGFREIISVE